MLQTFQYRETMIMWNDFSWPVQMGFKNASSCGRGFFIQILHESSRGSRRMSIGWFGGFGSVPPGELRIGAGQTQRMILGTKSPIIPGRITGSRNHLFGSSIFKLVILQTRHARLFRGVCSPFRSPKSQLISERAAQPNGPTVPPGSWRSRPRCIRGSRRGSRRSAPRPRRSRRWGALENFLGAESARSRTSSSWFDRSTQHILKNLKNTAHITTTLPSPGGGSSTAKGVVIHTTMSRSQRGQSPTTSGESSNHRRG